METAAEKRKRRAAIVARAKANPNASDKGEAGGKMVEAVKKKVASKRKAMSEGKKPMTDTKYKSKKGGKSYQSMSKRDKEIYDAVRKSGG